jgi:alkylation response protein AidB-like acyl-CoA dehydrogenase
MRLQFEPTDEQRLLRESVRAYLARGGDAAGLWRGFAAELGVTALVLPEARGGIGGDPVDTMVVLEEIGAALAPVPFVEAILQAGRTLDDIGDARSVPLLEALAVGDRTLVVVRGATARREGDGWRLTGGKTLVGGGMAATGLLVAADTGSGLSLFIVDAVAVGVTVTPVQTIDARPAAEIALDVILPSEALLGDEGAALPAIEAGVDAAIAGVCAEAVGVMRIMLADTIAYTLQRRQFGQALADFQVLRHRIAEMAIAIECALSAAWLATGAQSAAPTERARACATAKATVAEACRFVGQQAVQLHGGMGMTDELTLGRYFRRATAIEAAFGSRGSHMARLAAMPPAEPAVADLSPQNAAFRDEVRAFLDAELTPRLREAGSRCTGVYNEYGPANAWHRILARRGWSVPSWPVEHGGPGWSAEQQSIFASELTAAGAPRITPNATNMVAPVLMAFGTDEQKARYLPAIRSGDDWWAQGYSEPGSGSDLASLSCRAVRDGDHYVINGSKIWTTHAHFSNRIFCLVRTARLERPQQGISFLLFDLDLPGITIRPIISISGEHELNEVFFEDVRVPVSALLGAENDGWTVAKYLLQHERSGLSSPFLRARFARIRARAGERAGPRGDTMASDPVFAERLAAAEMRIAVLDVHEQRVVAGDTGVIPAAAAPSAMKILSTELRQHLTELAIEVEGEASTVLGQTEASDAMAIYFNDRAASIYAGTNEVQRNIIANALIR